MKNPSSFHPIPLFREQMASWLCGRLVGLEVYDRIDGRPHERGAACIDVVTSEDIASCLLLSFRYVLHVKCDGINLRIACEPYAVEPIEAPRPTHRVMIKLIARGDPDLAAAWNAIVDRADASSDDLRFRRSWGADVKRVIFYHPKAPEAKRSCPNVGYSPIAHLTLEAAAMRLVGGGRTDDICANLDAAFDDCAGVPHDQAIAAMMAAERIERAAS